MAYTGLWLHGAKGKLAGAVAQKGENGTVLRARVVPSNPRTIAQMTQRVAFGTAATAAKLLLPLIGQTFEGAGSEKLNRRAFMKANITPMKNYITSFITEAQDSSVYGFNPKGANTVVVPNPWIIASGTLPQPGVSISVENQGHDDAQFDGYNFGSLTVSSDTEITAEELVEALFGIQAGSQLTFAAIIATLEDYAAIADNTDVSNSELPSLGVDVLRLTDLGARRLVTKASDGSTLTVTAETTAAQLRTLLLKCIDVDKTSASILQNLNFSISTDENNHLLISVSAIADRLLWGFDPTSQVMLAAGVFQSRLVGSVWKYSFCRMLNIVSTGDITSDGIFDPTRWGFWADNAILSYLDQSTVTSKLYTRQGDEAGNSIGSF